MDKTDMLNRLAEIKGLVTNSGINPTVIGEMRMLIWLAEKELERIDGAEGQP